MNLSEGFEYYKQVCAWNCDLKVKMKILSNILEACYKNHWRVTGVTKEALNVFKAHNYKKVSRMGINRGHIHDRHDTLKQLIQFPFDNVNDWWNFYYDRDTTILMTSTENMSNQLSEVYDVPQGVDLFHTSGFAWKHGKDEIKFLTELE